MTALFVFIGIVCGVGTYIMYLLCKDIDGLRRQLKDADRRYQSLYEAYVEVCNANPNRPRMTTMAQSQWNAMNPAKSAAEFDRRKQNSWVPGTTMTQEQWDYLKKYGKYPPHTEDPNLAGTSL